jgi:diguanylate cyclase (GGDEF)-like protein
LTTTSIRTLLVENGTVEARSMRAELASAKHTSFDVEHRRTLRSAVSRVRAGGLDIVLLDLDVPGSSGVDAVVRLHAAAPDTPIVVLTPPGDLELAAQSLQACAEDYFVKGPSSRGALEAIIRHSLERHRSRAARDTEVEASQRDEARVQRVFATCSDGIAVVSPTGQVLFANASMARLLGCALEDLHGEMLGHPFFAGQERELALDGGRVVEVHAVKGEWNGSPVWIASLFDITGHKRTLAVWEDACTRLQTANALLERLASIDPLTAVLNRRGLDAAFSVEVQRMLRGGAPLAAILLDCDDFKLVNERVGHSGGDGVLKDLARRLSEALRPSDHLGRIGGDEFLVLLPETRLAEAFQVAERLRLSVSDGPMRLAGRAVRVTASLGLALLPDDVESIDDVLVRTGASLQHSKRSGKNRLSTQEVAGSHAEADAERFVLGLGREGAFRVTSQAILCLASECVTGWELCPRGPSGIFESPRDFFRLALERNILTQVDLGCLHACLAHARRSEAASCFHVNLFPSTLIETPLERLLELLAPDSTGLRLCIELSEQRLVGAPSLLRDRVRSLKRAGILVAIDDVGFGCSSLESLILLEPDIVKTDPAFVRRASRDADRLRSLRRMVDVVASLGSELVAEGIETRRNLEQLIDIGVRYGQGPLFDAAAELDRPQSIDGDSRAIPINGTRTAVHARADLAKRADGGALGDHVVG